jgi:hypothetical protein
VYSAADGLADGAFSKGFGPGRPAQQMAQAAQPMTFGHSPFENGQVTVKSMITSLQLVIIDINLTMSVKDLQFAEGKSCVLVHEG